VIAEKRPDRAGRLQSRNRDGVVPEADHFAIARKNADNF